jgi:hypothetical protein
MHLPDQAGRAERYAVVGAGRCTALVVVKAAFCGVVNRTDIPNDVGRGDQRRVACAS